MTLCRDVIAQSSAQFGTSGVRGLVEDLDDATCFAYTLGFLDHARTSLGLQAGADIWVGMDLRPSSPRMAAACLAAIRHAGFSPIFCGALPTPALAFTALQAQSPAVMITGSHIPFDRNGIKFYRADGEMMKQDEDPVITCAAAFPAPLFNGNELKDPPTTRTVDTRAEANWLSRYQAAFPGLLEGMTIGHYQHSAAGRDLLSQLLANLGATVVPIGRAEEFVPVDTEAVSEADANQARAWVGQHRLDALISTDGDGDRPLLADDTGTYFRGDALGILAARALQASAVVTPVSSNGALELSQWFETTHRTKIGSPHVIAAMQQAADASDRVVGFEANGGFLSHSDLPSPWHDAEISPLPTRDSVLPVLATIALARKMRMALSGLHGLLPQRVTASDRLENTPRDKSLALIAAIVADLSRASSFTAAQQAPVHTDQTDGLRMTYGSGEVVHIRPSGNAPELRIYVETDSEAAAADLLRHARSVIQALVTA